MPEFALTITETQYAELHNHLFPGDGLEAVAILLCGRRQGRRHRLAVREVILLPHERCDRAANYVTWPTDILPPLLEKAAKRNLAVLKIHGHESLRAFSRRDDASDRALFPSVTAWLDHDFPGGSLVMMQDGELLGRMWLSGGDFAPMERIAVIGDDIKIWRDRDLGAVDVPEHAHRVAQSFGRGTFDTLRELKVGVVGCSGTGSPVIEMLARNCVGSLVLVDPDVIEARNLNRIINSTRADVETARPKVAMLANAIEAMGMGTRVETYQRDLFDREIVAALADCDVLFGCMDSIDGRHLLNRLATFYAIPYFDLGVKLEADGNGGVDQVAGSVHYLKPGGSSLISRHVYSSEQLRAAALKRTNPESYRDLLAEGYIKGVAEDRPAVIQLNMLIASFGVNELLARLHPYRLDDNRDFAVRRVSLTHNIFEAEDDGEPCAALAKNVGRGDIEPPLDWPELSQRAEHS